MPIRSLAELLGDLSQRQRPPLASKNRSLAKIILQTDTVAFSSDPVTTTISSGLYKWGIAASTGLTLTWNLSEWS